MEVACPGNAFNLDLGHDEIDEGKKEEDRLGDS
jgi:hypothetical protein